MWLKLDVEGSEYETILSADNETLCQFNQIAIELHWLHRLVDPDFCVQFSRALSKLNQNFTLFHVHANNCAPCGVVEGIEIADVLELSYVRTSLVERKDSKTAYPTELDFPNDPTRPDIPLPFFPFTPGVSATASAAPGASDMILDRSSRPLRILYLACHETLEFDDVRMLTAMGHRVFSVGGLADPTALRPATRPVMPRFYWPERWAAFAVDPGNDLISKRVSRAFASHFDVVIVNHDSVLLDTNEDAFRGMPIIFRSVGQSNADLERVLSRHVDRVQIVRYSQRDPTGSSFGAAGQVIYFGKFLFDYPHWQPGSRVVTFHNGFPSRSVTSVPTLCQYEELARSGNLDLYGFLNEGVEGSRGVVAAEMQLELFRTAGLYLYVYSLAASYTLSFVEAMLVGVPIVAPAARAVTETLGPVAQAFGFFDERYEIAELLDHDPMLIWNHFDEIPMKIHDLLLNLEHRLAISGRLRAKAAAIFDVRSIAPRWEVLLQGLVESDH
jgi:hypothetical protein